MKFPYKQLIPFGLPLDCLKESVLFLYFFIQYVKMKFLIIDILLCFAIYSFLILISRFFIF